MKSIVVFWLLLSLAFLSSFSLAQSSEDDAYKADRQKAMALFDQNKYLDALPLFEELASKNPKDDGVLLGLATGLVSKAAAIKDANESPKLMVRARELLLKAQQLGNKAPLLLNLLQMIPQDGVMKYSENAAVDEALHEAEADFAKRDFDGAIKAYSKVLELDPKNYAATLFIGDSYFAKNDFPNAGEWYEKASQIDPDKETPYRYYSDMLTKNGEMDKARTKAIQAVVAEPYNAVTWRGLQQWAHSNHVQLIHVRVNTPAAVSQDGKENVNITLDPNQSSDAMAVWLVYSGVKAGWHKDEFKKHYPSESQYRHSLAEEAEALTAAAGVLVGNQKSEKKSSVPKEPDLALLLKLSQTGMIEPYVLLNAADEGIAQDYDGYRAKNREKLEQYLSQFVTPPTPAK
jgi:tetratricopeptide (TPR) repeat protein